MDEIKSSRKSLSIWLSRGKKVVLFSEVKEFEQMEFKTYEDLMEYVRACIDCGYKVG